MRPISELAAFTSYALAFPSAFQALVDTYNVCIFTMSYSHPLCGSSAPGPIGFSNVDAGRRFGIPVRGTRHTGSFKALVCRS
jgi:hypothetical protein